MCCNFVLKLKQKMRKRSFILILICFSMIVLLQNCNNSNNSNNNNNNNNNNNQNSVISTDTFSGISMFNGENLDGWKITAFGTEGPVQVTGNTIVLGMGDGLTGITWTGAFPKINYEVSLEAQKLSGNDFFCGITFPVDSTFCSFIVGGWGGPVVGLSTVDGRDASENSTKILKRFEKEVWYRIRLKVTASKIEAWIDNEKVVDFKTEGHEIYIRPEVQLSKPFGIASWITTAALRNIRLEKIEN